jgi:tRNA(fMet)-specific endonuclease VapC
VARRRGCRRVHCGHVPQQEVRSLLAFDGYGSPRHRRLLDLLKGHRRGDPYKRHVDGKAIAISVVTIGELYSGATKNEWGPAKLQNLESRLRTAVIISLDLDVCHAYATIRNQKSSTGSHRVVETNDAWIAACAVRHALPLVSNNRRHFDWIPGLTLICEAPALMSPTSGLLPLSRTAKDKPQ